MTQSEREQWLLDRKSAIGGSEIGALLSHVIPEVRYGCRRNLWYSKSNYPSDFEQEESAPMQLGNLMEGPACDLYADLTGNKVKEVDRMVHPELAQASVSVDRLVEFQGDEIPGVIEAKNTGNRTFYEVKRNGNLPVEYLCQLNQGILIAGAALGLDIKRGVMVVGKSDDPKFIARTIKWHLKQPLETEINPGFLLHWEQPKDDRICDAIMREIPIFWNSLGDKTQIPDRLENEDDPRCGRCQFRVTCRGHVAVDLATGDDIPLAEDLTPLVVEYLERKKISDDAEELTAETVGLLKIIMADRTAVQVPVGGKLRPLYFRSQEGQPAYAAAVKEMSVGYNLMREKLIQIEKTGDVGLAAGSELVPVPSTYVKRGKPFRVFRPQYLGEKPKKEE
jgi:hypothetical protein